MRTATPDKRKEDVIRATCALIAEVGLEDTTVRTVAKFTGYSTTIVTHYFRSKAELMKEAFAHIVDCRRTRLSVAVAGSSQPVKDALLALLPLDDNRRKEWKVFSAYTGSGVAKPELAAIHSASIRRTTETLADLVSREMLSGSMSTTMTPGQVAHELIFFLAGAGIVALTDPTFYTPAKLTQAVELFLSRYRESGKAVAPWEVFAAGNV
jgi:AcrR family transcriptional regulator